MYRFFFRNIPFPKILKQFYTPFKKKINGISHIPKFCYTPLYRFLLGYNFWCLVYPISRKNCETHVPSTFWDIPGISHFSKNRNIPLTGNFIGYPWDIPYSKKNRKFLCRGHFLGYPWDIPYPKKTDNFYVL